MIDARTRAAAKPIAAAAVRAASPRPSEWAVDPLDQDRLDDDVVVTTRRGICRVALVAAETAGRFQRDGLRYDPMSWMLAPRKLFRGVPALDACLDRDACLRGILVHGLSLGLDIDAATLDALTEDDDGPDADPGGTVGDGVGASTGENDGDRSPSFSPVDGERLFSATVISDDGMVTVQAFHASLARDPSEIAGRLFLRMGAACADAVIVEGFDPSDPLVEALVSPAVADTLLQVVADPASPLAAGLDLNVEQRFLR